MTLRILHLEDNALDAELIWAMLHAAGVSFDASRVDTRAGFELALDGGGFDVILSDYTLPAYDGLSALKLARERRPEIPFIFVSGTIGEDAAVESLLTGATDYVLKHRTSRLVPAVQRALREAETEKARRQAEAALRRERDLVTAIMATIPIGMVRTDTAGRFVLANPKAEQILGLSREQLISRSIDSVEWGITDLDGRPVPGEEWGFSRIVTSRKPASVNQGVERQDGKRALLSIQGAPLFEESGEIEGVVYAMEDITERRNMEEQLRQAQKLDAVGRLAGGVAHDFNNLLTAILSCSEALMDGIGPGEPLHQEVQEIQTAAKRAASLTRQLLTFSRRQVVRPKVLKLNEIVAGLDRMLRRLISENVELVVQLGGGTESVRIDPGQLEQVIVNLVVNARDAMPDGGRITIATAVLAFSAQQASRLLGLAPGAYVVLTISDTGCGMDAATQAHLFEPFFTTKQTGKGTGLGLSTAYGIVKQANGHIEFSSETGKGSVFRVYLPRIEEAPESLDSSDKPLHPLTTAHGSESVLLAEDEPLIRGATSRALRSAGYRVMEASDGEEALRLAASATDSIDLLVTDVVMPRLGGEELARRLREIRPQTKVLFVSGYAEYGSSLADRCGTEATFLQKPFTPGILIRAIRELLDRREELPPSAMMEPGSVPEGLPVHPHSTR